MNNISENCVFRGLTNVLPEHSCQIEELCLANQGPNGGVNSIAVLEALEEAGIIKGVQGLTYDGLPPDADWRDLIRAEAIFGDWLREVTRYNIAGILLKRLKPTDETGHFETLPPETYLAPSGNRKLKELSTTFALAGGNIIIFDRKR